MKRKKPQRLRLQTTEQLFDYTSRFYDQLRGETDRGAALTAGAYLDDLLAAMLRRVFVAERKLDDEDMVENLLREGGALGAFATRIHLCYLIGLLGREVYEDLDTIRLLRNSAAHRYSEFSFDAPDVLQCCQQLNYWTPEGAEHPPQTNRDRFLFAAGTAAFELQMRGFRRRHAEAGKEFRIPWDQVVVETTTADEDEGSDRNDPAPPQASPADT